MVDGVTNTFLSEAEIQQMLSSKEMVIRPLLAPQQVNGISIDFRLGTEFLVSIQGREPFVNASLNVKETGSPDMFYQETRRKVGETFLLHPNQTVLASSLEYIKLPPNVFATLSMRSSYSRLGLSLSLYIQPGYCGCISLELTNTNKFAVNLTVGVRLFQATLFKLDKNLDYFTRQRKYICQVRPKLTVFHTDSDLDILHNIWKNDNGL